MTFYERYAKIAESQGLEPCSQKAADMFGLTKSTISVWGVRSTTPKGETVAVIADKLGVSADYLLGRTDDPTDFTKLNMQDVMKEGRSKTVMIRKPDTSDTDQTFLMLYGKLDASDKLRIEGVIQGMLMADKYYDRELTNAAHVRTDVEVTPEMITHDENIMDDDNF